MKYFRRRGCHHSIMTAPASVKTDEMLAITSSPWVCQNVTIEYRLKDRIFILTSSAVTASRAASYYTPAGISIGRASLQQSRYLIISALVLSFHCPLIEGRSNICACLVEFHFDIDACQYHRENDAGKWAMMPMLNGYANWAGRRLALSNVPSAALRRRAFYRKMACH